MGNKEPNLITFHSAFLGILSLFSTKTHSVAGGELISRLFPLPFWEPLSFMAAFVRGVVNFKADTCHDFIFGLDTYLLLPSFAERPERS
jgi:hypothetical protein